MDIEKIPEQRVPSEIINESTSVPSYLQNSYNPKGLGVSNPVRFDIDIPPAVITDKYTKRIEFNIPISQNLLDPYSLYLEIDVENAGKLPIQLDGSSHSIISRIEISVNGGYMLECIKDYDIIHNILFDMHLGKAERKLKKLNEGFGDNDYGTNETIIYPKYNIPSDFLTAKTNATDGSPITNFQNNCKEENVKKEFDANMPLFFKNFIREALLRRNEDGNYTNYKNFLKVVKLSNRDLIPMTDTDLDDLIAALPNNIKLPDLFDAINNQVLNERRYITIINTLKDTYDMLFNDSILNKLSGIFKAHFEDFERDLIGTFKKYIATTIDGIDVPNYDQWEYVVNGEISPYPNDVTKINTWGNIKKFRIPIMSKALGWGLPKEVYKFIPLNAFSGLKITFYINEFAFFVPVLGLTERDYYLNTINSKIEDQIKDKNGLLDKTSMCSWYIKNTVKIHTEQYKFNDSTGIHQRLLNNVINGEYMFDYLGYEILSKDIIQKQSVNLPFNKSFTKKRIKSMYFFFTTDLHEWSFMARKLGRFNFGVKKIKVINDCITYPPEKVIRYNSMYTDGTENAQFFFTELLKNFNTQYNPIDSLINPTNFCLEYQLSHGAALVELSLRNELSENVPSTIISPEHYGFTNRQWWKYYVNNALKDLREIAEKNKEDILYDYSKISLATEFKQDLPDISSKTIYVVNFETLPFSNGVYKNLGIDIRCDVPVMFEIERDQKHINTDEFNKYKKINYYMWIMLETYETFQLNPDGASRTTNF